MKVPFLDLTRENKPLLNEIKQRFEPILENSHFVLGETVSNFETEVHSQMNLPEGHFTLGVSSGTDALLLALMLLDLPRDTKVITTPFTFFATAGCIYRAGLVPVFVDIDPGSYNLDAEKAAELDASDIGAVMPVHLYGQTADLNKLGALCEQRNWHLIEDIAQAIGARYKDQVAGSFGVVGGVSFYPTKNLGAFGDAGLLIGKAELAEKAQRMRVHGMRTRYEYLEIGGNFRLDALQAAVLSVKLMHLADYTEKRRQHAARYRTELAELEKNGFLVLPAEQPNCFHTYNQFVVRVNDGRRDDLMKYLNEQGIGCAVYYPTALHREKSFEDRGYKKGDFPESEKAALEVLALPVYPFLAADEQAYTIEKIQAFFK